MYNFVIRLFFLNLIVLAYGVVAQEKKIGIDPERPLISLSMDQWTGKDGLVSNNLTSVQQSSSHFIWLTSFNGILRFDGNEFKLYDKNSLPFINSNGFYQSYEDSKGQIFFSSQGSGVIKYADQKFQALDNSKLRSLSVRCIKEDPEGNYWIGTNNQGIFYLADTTLEEVKLDGLKSLTIMDIEIDDEEKVWFATNRRGIYTLKGDKIEKITADEGLNSNTVNKLLIHSNNILYAGTADGVLEIDGGIMKRLSVLDGIEVNDLLIDDYDNLWIGSEQGLFKFHLPTSTFDRFTEEDGLPASQVSGISFDHENSLWITTKKAGLIRFREGFFKNVTSKDRLSSNNANIVVEHQGAMYIGCDDGLINVFKDSNVDQLKVNSSYYNVGIRDINFGSNDEMLIASYRGLLVIKDGAERTIDLTQYALSNDIRRILRSSNGDIWLATRSSGVIKLKDLEIDRYYNSSNGLKSDYILALEEGVNGEIFIGTHSGGLSMIDSLGKVVNYPIEGGKPGILIFNMDIQEDNTAWIATNIGIYKFENGDFTKVHLDESLGAETVFDIVIANENAWFSSNIGLIQVALTEMEAYLEGQLEIVSARLFDRYDGMGSQECTGATRMTKAGNGRIWIPTLGGVAVLNPLEITDNEMIPEVHITEFTTDFQSRDLIQDVPINIDPDIVRYDFHFTSLSFIAPSKIRFKYKLEGIDEEWIEAGNEREAVYTNLPKGAYTFTVIASNNDGVWNTQGSAVKFLVLPYFYETTFFYILVLICLSLLIWGIIAWRTHNISKINTELLKLNEELDRFVYSASHDLRAPLSSVMGLVSVAKLESSLERKDECLVMINESVHKLDGFIDDIIDYSRNKRIDVQSERINLKKEIKEIYKELKYLDTDEAIKMMIECEEESQFVTDSRRVNIILKNLISNSIKYHDFKKEDQFIKVEVNVMSDLLQLTVKDNGIGIDEEHQESIFKMFYRADEGSKGSGLGLYIVKETVEKLKGNIEVSSKVGEGTTFKISIPVMA